MKESIREELSDITEICKTKATEAVDKARKLATKTGKFCKKHRRSIVVGAVALGIGSMITSAREKKKKKNKK